MSEQERRFDLVVIGAGPGGYVSAIRAAQLGKRVALVEEDRLGGTCLNRGCIPTKALMHTAEVIREFKSAEELGIKDSSFSLSFPGMHERKKQVVDKLVSGVEALIAGNKIDYYSDRGRVTGPHTVVAGDETLDCEYILLATGSKPHIPPIPGLDTKGVVTSDEILTGDGLKTDSLIIIGGGVIGVEIASIYNAIGAEVTIIEAMDRILPNMDKEISQNLSMILKKRGITINTGARVEKVEEAGEGLKVTYVAKEKRETAEARNLLVAIGRMPNTSDLLDESLGIEMERGFVKVDETGKTSCDSIYAIGDIVLGGIQLAHAASATGINAVESMFGVQGAGKSVSTIPSGIYTDPEIASVGMTEAQVKEAGIPYKAGKAMTSANGKTIIESGDRGYVKLIFATEDYEPYRNGQLLGAQIVSKRATDMIGGIALAMSSQVTLEEMSSGIWPHPTFSEVIGEAIEDALDGSIHAMPKRR